MACTTSIGPTRVPPYSSVVTLSMKLAGPLFNVAMEPKSIANPEDKTYEAWFRIREVAHRMNQAGSCRLLPYDLAAFKDALAVAHAAAHPCSTCPPALRHCECETAVHVKSIMQLLAGEASR